MVTTKLKLFGYVRVSTKGQVATPGVFSIDRRPGFERLIKELVENKAQGVVVTKLDRFGRSVQDLVVHISKLQGQGQHFISIGDNIDTSTPNGRLMFLILAAFAEFEREIIRERMKAGRIRANEMGKVTHRPRTLLTDPVQLEELKTLYEKQVSVASLARIFEVSRPTVYKRLHELGIMEIDHE